MVMAKSPKRVALRTALVIGATGGIGKAVAAALNAHGWTVKALPRDPERAKATVPDLNVTCMKGDAMNEAEVVAAAGGADILFHGANPRGYRRWRELAIPMLANNITAARASGARLIFPGNVYNSGPDAGAVVSEVSAQNPLTGKGAVQVEMEQMLNVTAADGVRSLVGRAGDFRPHARASGDALFLAGAAEAR